MNIKNVLFGAALAFCIGGLMMDPEEGWREAEAAPAWPSEATQDQQEAVAFATWGQCVERSEPTDAAMEQCDREFGKEVE